MTLSEKIDRLSEINEQITKLKNEKTTIEAEITKHCEADLENTKLKSQRYVGETAELTATNAESLKITYASFLPAIFGAAYKDVVTESTTYKLSAYATRMLVGLWKGDFVKCSVSDVINQIPNVMPDDRKQLLKKCKGKNYTKDVDNLMKFSGMSYENASEWAYMISEAEIWQSFLKILELNGVSAADETAVDEILTKIQAAFVVEDSTKNLCIKVW
jgi:hypothetical protein